METNKTLKRRGIYTLLACLAAMALLLFHRGSICNASNSDYDWYKYSNRYYYNQLPAKQQAIYDEFDKMAYYYLTHDDDLTNEGSIYVPTDYTCEEMFAVFDYFYYENPQYYFLKSIHYGTSAEGDGSFGLDINKAYLKGSVRAACSEEFRTKVESWLSEINQEKTDFAKEKKAHDLLLNRISFQFEDKYNYIYQSAYSTFHYNSTVCAGYAKAFCLLMNSCDIDCICVPGAGHLWNKIRLNDNWFNVDCTYDDDGVGPNDKPYYRNFNRNDHVDQIVTNTHIPQSDFVQYLPACTIDSGASSNYCGAIPSITQKVSTPSITITKNGSSYKASISCSTSGAKIYYTLDGTTPSPAKTVSHVYNGSFTVSDFTDIKAVAVCNTYRDSTVASKYFNAQSPKISTNPKSISYQYGSKASALTVKASTSDGGKLSYQWYSAPSNKASGGTAIKNATSSSYTPPSSNTGTRYYYCVITNTNSTAYNKKTAIATTSVSKVTVTTANVSKCKVTGVKAKTYSGKKLTQSPTVTFGSTTLRSGSDYTLSYKNNKAIGKATMIITGKGNYSGSKTVTFSIRPVSTSIRSLTSIKKGITVSLKKGSHINGYQIQYSTSKKFSSYKLKKLKKSSITRTTIKNLSSKKKYYVRVRTYRIIDGHYYYSTWSSAKAIKTK